MPRRQGAPIGAGNRPAAAKVHTSPGEARVQWWMAAVGLAVVLAWSAWDLGRAGRTSAPALTTLRAVGGLGLLAMAIEALLAGFTVAAAVAALAAAPLVGALAAGAHRARRPPVAVRVERPEPAGGRDRTLERRAA